MSLHVVPAFQASQGFGRKPVLTQVMRFSAGAGLVRHDTWHSEEQEPPQAGIRRRKIGFRRPGSFRAARRRPGMQDFGFLTVEERLRADAFFEALSATHRSRQERRGHERQNPCSLCQELRRYWLRSAESTQASSPLASWTTESKVAHVDTCCGRLWSSQFSSGGQRSPQPWTRTRAVAWPFLIDNNSGYASQSAQTAVR